MGVGKEAAFDEDAWDFGLADDGEVAVFDIGWFSGGAVQGLVHDTGKFVAHVNLCGRGEACAVDVCPGADAAGGGSGTVAVDLDEGVGVVAVGDDGTLIERHVDRIFVFADHDDGGACCNELIAQLLCDVGVEIDFVEAWVDGADCAAVDGSTCAVDAVTGRNDDGFPGKAESAIFMLGNGGDCEGAAVDVEAEVAALGDVGGHAHGVGAVVFDFEAVEWRHIFCWHPGAAADLGAVDLHDDLLAVVGNDGCGAAADVEGNAGLAGAGGAVCDGEGTVGVAGGCALIIAGIWIRGRCDW